MDPSEQTHSKTVIDALSDSFREGLGEDIVVGSFMAVADALFPDGRRELVTVTSDIPEWQVDAMLNYLCEGSLVERHAPVEGDDEGE